ncbi:MAG TPA: SWIM zinc finger family protein [Acidimicrobiales bacterium]|nr:SWIM zinc finger family protein [Acidimicrobiales bacterium]
MSTWAPEQVLGLAPDAASARAARGLATPRRWSGTGSDDRALWGLCHGSGTAPYQVAVALGGPAFRCSCPSRKVPCKHVVALLLLWALQPEAVPPASPPGWAEEWLAGRLSRAEPSGRTVRPGGSSATTSPNSSGEWAAGAAGGRRPVDPAARAKRAADRAERIGAGLDELDRWLRDLVRQGLGAAQAQPYRFWDTVAARMVDAQAPGVGSQVRRMAGAAHGDGWPGRLLEQAGRLHLVTTAWPRRDWLPPETQADLRTVVGWAVPAEEVLGGSRLRGRWHVVARTVAEEERLRVQRTRLLDDDGRPALVLDFAPTGAPLPADLVVATVVDADLAFYPGSFPLRAVVAHRHALAEPMTRLPGHAALDDALAAHARALAANPWLERFPVALTAVVPCRRGEGWVVRDEDGTALPLGPVEERAWKLVALSGGRPLGLVAEWWDARLWPLSAWADGRLVSL